MTGNLIQLEFKVGFKDYRNVVYRAGFININQLKFLTEFFNTCWQIGFLFP